MKRKAFTTFVAVAVITVFASSLSCGCLFAEMASKTSIEASAGHCHGADKSEAPQENAKDECCKSLSVHKLLAPSTPTFQKALRNNSWLSPNNAFISLSGISGSRFEQHSKQTLLFKSISPHTSPDNVPIYLQVASLLI